MPKWKALSVYRRRDIIAMEMSKKAPMKVEEHLCALSAGNGHRTTTVMNEDGAGDKERKVN